MLDGKVLLLFDSQELFFIFLSASAESYLTGPGEILSPYIN
jgi:hypothetical protein